MPGEDLFKAGSVIQVLDHTEQISYSSAIQKVAPQTIAILEPVCSEKKLFMPTGSSWNFVLIRGEALYFFKAGVLGGSGQNTPGYLIERPEKIQRLQRRQHVRVFCSLDVDYWAIENEQRRQIVKSAGRKENASSVLQERSIRINRQQLKQLKPARKARVLNLSGGGLMMVTSESLAGKSKLLLSIGLATEGLKEILAEGTVIRVVPVSTGFCKKYRVGVAFSNIRSGVRERIIRFVFKMMRRRL